MGIILFLSFPFIASASFLSLHTEKQLCVKRVEWNNKKESLLLLSKSEWSRVAESFLSSLFLRSGHSPGQMETCRAVVLPHTAPTDRDISAFQSSEKVWPL